MKAFVPIVLGALLIYAVLTGRGTNVFAALIGQRSAGPATPPPPVDPLTGGGGNPGRQS